MENLNFVDRTKETVDFIIQKYGSDINSRRPIKLPISRWNTWLELLNALGVKTMVEIGTYKGAFAECICKNMPGIDLTVVDAWKVYRGYKDYGPSDLESVAYEETKKRSEEFGFKIIRGWSLEAVQQFEDESLDCVFIDGNHDFRHVTEDVDEWSRKVKKGGIVAGHDFFRNPRKNFGVKEAIPAWCAANEIHPLFVVAKDQCPSWFYIKQ